MHRTRPSLLQTLRRLLTLAVCVAPRATGFESTPPRVGEAAHCEPTSKLLIAAEFLAPSCEVAVAGIDYTVAFDDDEQVIYVGVSDPDFETEEGIQVGSTLEEVLETGAAPSVAEPGWVFHTRLPSGWRPTFTHGDSLTETPLPAGFFRAARLGDDG